MRRVLLVVTAVLLCAACTGQDHTQLLTRPAPILWDPASPISITYHGALRSDPPPQPTPAVAVSREQALGAVLAGAAPQGQPKVALRLVTLTYNPPTGAPPRLMWVLVWPEQARPHGKATMTPAQSQQAMASAAKVQCVGIDAVDANTARVHGYWVMCA